MPEDTSTPWGPLLRACTSPEDVVRLADYCIERMLAEIRARIAVDFAREPTPGRRGLLR